MRFVKDVLGQHSVGDVRLNTPIRGHPYILAESAPAALFDS
jgi:hypothetical protein